MPHEDGQRMVRGACPNCGLSWIHVLLEGTAYCIGISTPNWYSVVWNGWCSNCHTHLESGFDADQDIETLEWKVLTEEQAEFLLRRSPPTLAGSQTRPDRDPIGRHLSLAVAACLALAVVVHLAGGGLLAVALASFGLIFLLLAALVFYMDDRPAGNADAVRGMIVGALALSGWFGWGSAWTTNVSDSTLVVIGSMVGGLAGTLFGGIFGVFLGRHKSAALSWLAGRRRPPEPAAGDVGDAWLDGP